MKNIFCWLLLFSLAACTSTPVKESEDKPVADRPVETPAKPVIPKEIEEPLNVDYVALHGALNLDRAPEALGYREQFFNTCEVGFGYPSNRNCHRQVFVSIHFRLLCRDSDGTLSKPLTENEMFPLSGRSIRWTLGKKIGDLQLDGQGYGQIRTVASISQKTQRLKINADNNFLYLQADEIHRIVTPKDWCNQ